MLPLLEKFPACPGCANANVRSLHVFRNIKPIVETPFLALLGCPVCGLVYNSPRPTEEQLSQYYDPTNEDGWGKGRSVDDAARADHLEKWLIGKRTFAGRLLDAIGAFVAIPDTPERQAFDFGCGGGALLDVLQDRGWKTTGLEPARLRKFAESRHVMIDRIPDAECFDFVNVSHVLEHLLYPAQVLEALARASRPGGVLLCSVPDLEALPRHHDFRYVSNPHHINSFTGASLTTMMQRTGWQPVRVMSAAVLAEGTVRDAAQRLIGVGCRDPAAGQLPLPREPLEAAENALRIYGRQLQSDGKPRLSSSGT
jgi:methyltransferase family protein